MPEIIQIGLLVFLRLSVAFALGYGLYRLIRLGISRIPDGLIAGKEENWDKAELINRVPSSIIGFLFMDILVVTLTAGVTHIATNRLVSVSGEIADLLVIIGGAGIFAATVFGIYQDYPPTRLKIFGVIAGFSVIAGIGAG